MFWICLSIGIVTLLVVRKAYLRYKARKVAKEIWRDYGQEWDQSLEPKASYFGLDYFIRIGMI